MPAASVAQLIDEVTRAWAAGDADAFTACYTEDATAILPGFHLGDRAAIRTAMAAAFAGDLRGSRRIHQLRSERHAEGTAILVTRSATLPAGAAEVPPGRWSLATWLLRRDGDGWRIAAYHDCPELGPVA